MTNEQLIRHEVSKIDSRLEWLRKDLDRTQGLRDTIAARLQDIEGAHDRRHVAVR